MLQKDYSRELIDLVQSFAKGEVLNKPTIDAICIGVEEEMGPIGITPYNIRQIVNMEDVDMSVFSSEEIAENIIDRTYNTSFVKTYKAIKEKDYIKKSRLLGSTTDFLEHLKTFIEGYKPHEQIKFTPRSDKRIERKTIALTDLHLGKQNTELILWRMSEIATNIIKSSVTHVDIFCAGDLVETLVQGGMHEGQIEVMENTYGFDLLMETVSVFESFLLSIAEAGITVEFYGLSGNHDRLTKDREGDKARLGGLVIYELIKRGLSGTKEISINIIQDSIYTVDIDSIRYIIAHGDSARMPTRAGSDIAWIHGDNTKSHNVIMYGHLHNVAITEEKLITKIGLPGLAGKDQYATKTLDLHSEPAYVEITHNTHGSVDIIIKRLQNG